MLVKLASSLGGGVVAGFFLCRSIEDKPILDVVSAKSNPILEDEFRPSTKWDWNWDKLQPEALVKPSKKSPSITDGNNDPLEQVKDLPKSTATRHIILIRHGQYNLQGLTDEERTLTELGERQAHLTGARLKELQIPFKRLVFSTMTRATQTANCIREHLGEIESVTSTDMLREGAPFPCEPPTSHWKPERSQFHTDGARIEAAFRAYIHRAPPSQTEDSYELVVCHANVIRYFVCRALQFPAEGWLRLGLHNGSITHLAIRPSGRVSLRQYSECGYMPPDAISTT